MRAMISRRAAILVLVLALALALVAVACGGSGDQASTASSADTAASGASADQIVKEPETQPMRASGKLSWLPGPRPR